MAAKKMPGENQPAPRSVVDQCVNLALDIVWARRRKYLKKKNRKSTQRSLSRFLRGPLQQQVARVLFEALTEAKHKVGIEGSAADTTPDQRKAIYSRAAWILFDRYCQENPRRGPKPAGGTGLMASKLQRPAHRPRTMSIEEEEAWINALYGVTLGLWAREELVRGDSEKAIDELIRSDTDNWQEILSRLRGKALLHPYMRKRNPSAKTPKALRERARLAWETFSPPRAFLEAQRKIEREIRESTSRPKVGEKFGHFSGVRHPMKKI